MINSEIFTEIRLITPKFVECMSEQIDKLHPFANDPGLYRFLNWAIEQNFNNQSKLYNDICTLPNYRTEFETYDEYKIRQWMVRKCLQYRSKFMELMIGEFGWTYGKKEKNQA